MADVRKTLKKRGGKIYGVFAVESVTTDALIAVMEATPNWKKLAPDQRVALRIDALKTARILHGDPDYADSWHDKAGYATLVDDRLQKKGRVR